MPAKRFPCCWANWVGRAISASQYIGGEYTARAHREDPDGKLPFEPIPVAKQRDAMKILKKRSCRTAPSSSRPNS